MASGSHSSSRHSGSSGAAVGGPLTVPVRSVCARMLGKVACATVGRSSRRMIRCVSQLERHSATCGVEARASSTLTVPQHASASREAR
eukprot:5201163-Prymnesium_polylepis.1